MGFGCRTRTVSAVGRTKMAAPSASADGRTDAVSKVWVRWSGLRPSQAALFPTQTVVAWVGFSSPFICLFIRAIFQKPMKLESPNFTKKCPTTSPENLFVLESKDQRSRSQRLCHLQTECDIDAGCTCNPRGVFPWWFCALLWVPASSS